MMQEWLGFGDFAFIFKVTAELNRSDLRALARHLHVCKISFVSGGLVPNVHGHNIGA